MCCIWGSYLSTGAVKRASTADRLTATRYNDSACAALPASSAGYSHTGSTGMDLCARWSNCSGANVWDKVMPED